MTERQEDIIIELLKKILQWVEQLDYQIAQQEPYIEICVQN